ncbi:hypothetical protein F0562_006940 [Nyssa sinensis]|uniref:DUF8003 domain-containing protein n=1 Tax=Nyssa sinensis TaxID=561372 RepID=A0A5J5A589_9ASTE|nr:hypothetical protein F0562_006940 [Nyssa sinensis]
MNSLLISTVGCDDFAHLSMARTFYFIIFIIFILFVIVSASHHYFSIIDFDSNLFHQDYSPPSPPPPPPHPPSVSCEDDLAGVGSVDTTCQIVANLNLTEDVYIEGKGNFYILPNLTADNATFLNGSLVNTTGLAGSPPPQTSGTPQGVDGAGGGHGGRGACCLADKDKLREDVWGGDAYSWSSLQKPWSYGSKGRTTSREVDYGGGGGGGGRIKMEIVRFLEVKGSFLADGGDGGAKGGGGSGGSIFVKARKMTGCGRISACGGVMVFLVAVVEEFLLMFSAGMMTLQSLFMEEGVLAAQKIQFPHQPLMTNVYVQNHAKVAVPLLWSSVQVEGQISLLCGGELSFGLAHYALSEFELLAEELLMSESTIKESSVIHSNANLGVHGQGLLNLSGPGDCIEAQRLVLLLFYSLNAGPGSVLRGPLRNATTDAVTPRLNCELQDCPIELLHLPEDCNVNSSLSFTLQICRVEDILVEGLIEGSVVHFHRARTTAVKSSGTISTSGLGYTGGVGRGEVLSNGLGSGGGHGGKGGVGCYNGSCIEGGISYGDADLPCELGSGSGNDSLAGSTAGGGIIVMGSWEHPLSSLSVEGSVKANGENFRNRDHVIIDDWNGGPGGGSGGTILLFLQGLVLGESGILSSVGGHGSPNGGGGGRIHFHWSDIPTGDVYQPIAIVKGSIHTCASAISYDRFDAEVVNCFSLVYLPRNGNGRLWSPREEVLESRSRWCRGKWNSDRKSLPKRALQYILCGGIAETPCPYKCISDRYHMPHCHTALEELMYTFGGPWLFGLLFLGLLILLALVLSVARMKFFGVDELPGPAPTQQGSQIDHSFPFLESLNEVLETNRLEVSQNHVYRIYFLDSNTFSEPWHLPHSPPEQVKEIVYEGALSRFVDEINAIASYQWWEGSIYSILSILGYPLAWSWKQWNRRTKLQRLREFVRSEYDHACLRSCRSFALYEGLKLFGKA